MRTLLALVVLTLTTATVSIAQSRALDSVHIDRRLSWARRLIIDTLVPLAGQHPGDVVVWPSLPNIRGEHKHGVYVAVTDPHDVFALLHEFGHHFAMSNPQEYMDWSATSRLDPWKASTFETFADVFARAVELLQHAKSDSRPVGRAGDREVRLARRLQLRPPFSTIAITATTESR